MGEGHRLIAVVVAIAPAAIAVAVVRPDRRRLTAELVNAGVLLVGLMPVTVIDHVLAEEQWLRIRRPEEFSGGPGIAHLTERCSTFLERLVVGQAWYLVAGSLGLVAFGAGLPAAPTGGRGPCKGHRTAGRVRRRAAG